MAGRHGSAGRYQSRCAAKSRRDGKGFIRSPKAVSYTHLKITSRHTTDGVPQFVDGALVDAVLGREGIKGHNSMDTLYLATSSRLKPARFTAENDSKASLARFLGNTDSSLHEYFILDILSLEEGRHIAPGDHRKAVVSREFAEMNLSLIHI